MKSNLVKISGCFLIAVSIFSSCTKVVGDGPVVTETRNATNFSEVEVSVPADIVFRQESTYKLEIEAQENIIDIIETPVSAKQLDIRTKNDVRVKTTERIRIIISAPDISHFRLIGSGKLSTLGNIQSNDMYISVTGSGKISIPNLSAKTLSTDISGSGDIHVLEGTVAHQTLKISGSGSIDLLNVVSKTASTNTSGSGDMKVNVSDRLDARISGSGNVYYKGSPLVSTDISGSGKVRPM